MTRVLVLGGYGNFGTRICRALTMRGGIEVIAAGRAFQGQDYRVARAAIEIGAHYLDLADAREFVVNFSRELDPLARAANVFAVCDASTLPALSTAVLDVLAARFERMAAGDSSG